MNKQIFDEKQFSKNEKYNKSYLVDKIHNKLNYLSKEDIVDSVNLVLNYLQQSLKEQKRIEIRGFGSFSVRQRKFPKNDKFYKTIYYRMPKNLFKD